MNRLYMDNGVASIFLPCICTHTYTHHSAHIHTYIRTYNIHTYVCLLCTYTYTNHSAHIHTYIRTCISTYTHMYTYSVSACVYMRYASGDAHRNLEHTVEPTHCLSGHHLHLFDNLCFLISSVEVGNISCIQDDIDVLNKGLVLNLVVAEEEHGRLALPTSLQHHLQEWSSGQGACTLGTTGHLHTVHTWCANMYVQTEVLLSLPSFI